VIIGKKTNTNLSLNRDRLGVFYLRGIGI